MSSVVLQELPASLPGEVRVILDDLTGRGVRLAVVDSKLVVVSGKLDDVTRGRIKRHREVIKSYLLYQQQARKTDLDRRIKIAREYCTPERGYEWERKTWLTAFEENRFHDLMMMYVNGEVELSVVQTAFNRYANTHKRRYRVTSRVNGMTDKYRRREVPFEAVVMATDDESPRVSVVGCVTPQWEPTENFAEEMFEFFGLTPEQYRSETDTSI